MKDENKCKLIKILFYSYSTCAQNKAGGVQTRIWKLYDLLNKIPYVQCDFFSTFETNIRDYDILHVFMLNSECYEIVRYAKEAGLKIVISSIVYLDTRKQVDMHMLLLNHLPILTTYKMMAQAANMADAIIAETLAEKDFLVKHYKLKKNILVIPNGAEKIESDSKEIFKFVKEKKYCLVVGRFDENKNQYRVIKAMKNKDISIVFIGGPATKNGDEYYKKCIREAEGSNNIYFLGWQNRESDILKSAYNNAEVVIIPSLNETFGMVVLEGGMSGAKLALSQTLPILEYDCFKDCRKFNPLNVEEMKKAISLAFYDNNDITFKDKLIKEFSWESIEQSHLELYMRLISDDKKNIFKDNEN